MAHPRGDFILRNALGATILCVVLLKENAVTVEGASESSAQIHPPASSMTNATSTTTTTEEYVHTFPTYGDEPEDLKPPQVEDFARPCLDNIHSFVFNSIVAHNMNKASANAMHHKTDNFKELAKNISTTMMVFAEQVSRLFYMYNLCTDPPIRLSPKDAPPPTTKSPTSWWSSSSSPPPQQQQSEKNEDAASSDFTVPLLLLVILTLSAYIGYLSYKMKTKYYRNSSILIEDH